LSERAARAVPRSITEVIAEVTSHASAGVIA
jgi:hypothetical protein